MMSPLAPTQHSTCAAQPWGCLAEAASKSHVPSQPAQDSLLLRGDIIFPITPGALQPLIFKRHQLSFPWAWKACFLPLVLNLIHLEFRLLFQPELRYPDSTCFTCTSPLIPPPQTKFPCEVAGSHDSGAFNIYLQGEF